MEKRLFSQTLYNDYLLTWDENNQLKLRILAKNGLRLGDVCVAIITYYDVRQHAYFAQIGKEEIYVKEAKSEVAKAVGTTILVEVSSEKINNKRTRASLKLTQLKLLKQLNIDCNPQHYRSSKILYRAEMSREESAKKHNSYSDFKDGKLKDTIYHHCDLIAELKSSLKVRQLTTKGAVFTIEELESLTAIDVDAGSFSAKADFAYQLNSHIAPLLCQQLKRREINGTVLIDFVNMNKTKQAVFVKEFKTIMAKSWQIKGFTATGLLELSIPKIKASLWQSSLQADGFGYKIKPEIEMDYQLDKIIYQHLKDNSREHKLYLPASHKAQTQQLLAELGFYDKYPDLKLKLEHKE